MRRTRWLIPLVIFLYSANTPVNASDLLDFSGYYKSFLVTIQQPDFITPPGIQGPDDVFLFSNTLRMNLSVKLGKQLAYTGAYSLSPRFQEPPLSQVSVIFGYQENHCYRVTDLEERLYPENDKTGATKSVAQNLDRFYLRFSPRFADIYLGRQAIAWGSARVVNPTDIVAPFSYEELDTEERRGVDALRIRVPFGFMSELDLGIVFGENFDVQQNAIFLRGKTYIEQTDVSTMVLWFQNNLMFGLDLARSLGGAGVWAEAAYTVIDDLEDLLLGGEGEYLRATIGMDYSLGENTYGFLEYHLNDAGVKPPDEYLFNSAQSEAYTKGSVFLMNKHYVIPGFSHQISPLVSGGGQFVYNVNDKSLFGAVTLDYNWLQNVYIGAGGFLGFGEKPVIAEQGPSLQSEFGFYPDFLYVTLKIYL